jgi:translocation and assembly module TamB
MKAKKFLSLPWIIATTLMLFFLSVGYLFLNTQKGLTLAVKFGQQWLPGSLKIAELNGHLLGPIQIKNLRYKNADAELSISYVLLDWHWSALLQGQLHITPLTIDKLILSIKEKKKENTRTTVKTHAGHFKLPTLFKHIRLDSIDIQQSIIRYGTNVLSLEGSLHQQWQFNWQLTIPQLANLIPQTKGQLDLKGNVVGARSAPAFYLTLAQTQLNWQDWQLNQLQGEFHTTLENKKWLFDLHATQLKNPTLSLKPVHLHLAGELQPFSLRGDLSGITLTRKTENSIHYATIPSSTVTAKRSSLGLETTLISNPNSADQLSAHILLPRFQGPWIKPTQPIKGNVQLTLKNLSLLESLLPQLKATQGLLDTQLTFSGPIFSPSMNATLNLQKGSTQIPSLGLHLENITLGFRTNKKVLEGTGQLVSGKGSLTFQSKTQLDHTHFASSLDINGTNVEVSHTHEYKITASPTLHIQADTNHVDITGLITFPKARIKINENNLNVVELSNDVVFVNQKKAAISLPFTYKAHIKLQLGDDIRFNYQGLRTKVIGALEINQITDHPLLATGELALSNGEYTYYGQSLKIQPHSLLTFANSPIDNPSLDVTANKSVWVLPNISNETSDSPNSKLGSSSFISSALQTTQPIRATVGIHLQGYLENPKITLYADPVNVVSSQLEILSYLVTGQPSNQLSAASMQLLLNIATQTGSKKTGINHLITTAQKKIGIDQLTIGANPIFNPTTNKLQQNTSLIVGKNFSPRLNVSYSLGLLDPISILQINYLLNKHFSLQSTNSNFANGIDLLYKLERK